MYTYINMNTVTSSMKHIMNKMNHVISIIIILSIIIIFKLSLNNISLILRKHKDVMNV